MLYVNLYRRTGLGKGFTIRAADVAGGSRARATSRAA